MKHKKLKKIILYFFIDFSLISLLTMSNYYFMYLMPRKEQSEKNESIVVNTTNSSESQNWKSKFEDKFSNNTIEKTASSYKSPDISITVSNKIYIQDDDNNKVFQNQPDLKTSENIDNPPIKPSQNTKSNSINYYVADIYISNLNCFKTHFAKNTYGTGYSESILDMESKNNSILSINGDSYSYNKSKNMKGPLVRNGTIYRNEPTDSDVCILYKDGTMKTYSNEEYKNTDINYDDVYNTWVFGPNLLSNNGTSTTTFNASSYIKKRHPRTAIGYYEPGHYCFVVADGRGLNENDGMYLEELSKIFENLGCKCAYNLDGGHCSFMTYDNNYVNNPNNKTTKITDGIFIEEEN